MAKDPCTEPDLARQRSSLARAALSWPGRNLNVPLHPGEDG